MDIVGHTINTRNSFTGNFGSRHTIHSLGKRNSLKRTPKTTKDMCRKLSP
jgi:hypothetical protein